MLDYIKRQLLAREELNDHFVENVTTEANENELINEYAHLFQELDDISVEGTDSGKTRKMTIDIPIEDDIEIESIEMNLTDGRVVDVPIDAAIQESLYQKMKTFDDFYQETVSTLTPLLRESEKGFERRCCEHAASKFRDYSDYIIQEGLFGFDKIDIGDDAVPSVVTIDFGPIKKDSDQSYFVKLKVLFEIDKYHKVLKKQLSSLNYAIGNNVFEHLGDAVMLTLKKKYNIPEDTYVWDVVTPTKIIVPIDPVDRYKVVIGFETEYSSSLLYMAWDRPIKSNEKNNSLVPIELGIEPKMVMNKKDFIKESAEIKKSIPNRFIQEAIDFDDESEEPTGQDGDSTSNEPIVDTGNTDGETTTDTKPDPDVTSVDSNNVSDQIANKVAAENDDKTDDIDATIPDDIDDLPPTDNNDTNISNEEPTGQDGDILGIDNTDDNSIDDKINDLDAAAGNTDDDTEETNDIDFDNMTIDQLIENGSEKLKGMTIAQLKSFLNDNNVDAIQEAFILTKKNINSEVDTHIRKALGILNTSDMSFAEIVKTFKSEGKQLNRVLSKAYKMKDVYSDEELNSIMKLNKSLTDLMVALKVQATDNDVAVAKRLIKIFTVQCTNVSEFVERKKMDTSSNNVQESFDDCFDDTDIVFQEVNLAGNIVLGLLDPVIGGIVAAVKISKSGADTHTSIIDLLTMLNNDPSIMPRKLIKKLKKLADNCLYLKPKVSKISESDQIVKLRTMCKSFAKFIKTNGIQNEAFKKEAINLAKQCAVVDEILGGDQKKINGATNNVQEDASVTVGPVYNPTDGNNIGEK